MHVVCKAIRLHNSNNCRLSGRGAFPTSHELLGLDGGGRVGYLVRRLVHDGGRGVVRGERGSVRVRRGRGGDTVPVIIITLGGADGTFDRYLYSSGWGIVGGG